MSIDDYLSIQRFPRVLRQTDGHTDEWRRLVVKSLLQLKKQTWHNCRQQIAMSRNAVK